MISGEGECFGSEDECMGNLCDVGGAWIVVGVVKMIMADV